MLGIQQRTALKIQLIKYDYHITDTQLKYLNINIDVLCIFVKACIVFLSEEDRYTVRGDVFKC